MSNTDFAGRAKRLVSYFWDPEPRNDDPSYAPIWCSGRKYDSKPHTKSLDVRPSSPRQSAELDAETVLVRSAGEASDQGRGLAANGAQPPPVAATTTTEAEQSWPNEFLEDFESRFWFTYRSQFPVIPRSKESAAAASLTLAVRLRSQFSDREGFASDTGWGCMIRSGQCLIANAIALLRLGREWRRGMQPRIEKELISLFADDPRAPFSVHRFVEHGAAACGKHPGEWFGPSAAARCIQALSDDYAHTGLRVYITGDGPDVYEDTIFRIASDGHEDKFKPVLILAGLRLGIDRLTPAYWDGLRGVMELPQFVGIAGGRPSASHYFVAVQGSNLFYLDPHHTRPILPYHDDPESYTQEEVDSCHTRRLRRLHLDQIDPSMLLAFLIRDRIDWQDWRVRMGACTGKQIIHIADHEPSAPGPSNERESALDEVEALDDDDDGEEAMRDDDDEELVKIPSP